MLPTAGNAPGVTMLPSLKEKRPNKVFDVLNWWSTRASNLSSRSCLFGLIVKLLTKPAFWGAGQRFTSFALTGSIALAGIWLPGHGVRVEGPYMVLWPAESPVPIARGGTALVKVMPCRRR